MERLFTRSEAADALGMSKSTFTTKAIKLGFKKPYKSVGGQYTVEEIIAVRDYERNYQIMREAQHAANVNYLKEVLSKAPSRKPEMTYSVKTGFKIVL